MPFLRTWPAMITAVNSLLKPSTRKSGMNPRFFVAFWCVFRLFFALYCVLYASFVSFPVKNHLRADFPVLLPYCFSCFRTCPSGLAALPQIVRAADQFRPKTLHAAVRTATADTVELSSTRCRIDEESPVQFVLFRHSGHRIISLLSFSDSAGSRATIEHMFDFVKRCGDDIKRHLAPFRTDFRTDLKDFLNIKNLSMQICMLRFHL